MLRNSTENCQFSDIANLTTFGCERRRQFVLLRGREQFQMPAGKTNCNSSLMHWCFRGCEPEGNMKPIADTTTKSFSWVYYQLTKFEKHPSTENVHITVLWKSEGIFITAGMKYYVHYLFVFLFHIRII